MLNLLPKDTKEKVRNEYLRRFAIVLLVGLTLIDLFFIVAIFPSYISASSQKKISKDLSESIKNSANTKNRDTVLSNVKDLEVKLNLIETVSGEKPSEYISKALSLKTNGIFIQNISYSKKDKTKKEVSLEGFASSRASFIEFMNKVKSSNWATSSDIPISNLANDKDIKFFVTLTFINT